MRIVRMRAGRSSYWDEVDRCQRFGDYAIFQTADGRWWRGTGDSLEEAIASARPAPAWINDAWWTRYGSRDGGCDNGRYWQRGNDGVTRWDNGVTRHVN